MIFFWVLASLEASQFNFDLTTLEIASKTSAKPATLAND
jgi:hypothetical protein